MSHHTSLRVGGPADLYAIPEDADDLQELLNQLAERDIPWLAIGKGNNLLVRDKGIRGTVISLERFNRISEAGDRRVRAEAGAENLMVVRFAQEKGLGGIGFISGIPGTVGGAVFGAIGAYGQTLAGVLEWVDILNLFTSERTRIQVSEITFSYRYSTFQSIVDVVILEAGFRLHLNKPSHHAHPDIAQLQPFTSTLTEVAVGVRQIRERKGAMLWLPHRGNNRSAGSFFKNPTVDQSRFDRLSAILDVNDTRRWWWTAQNAYRISAARLIELAGFERGQRVGDAAISPEHTLSLVNMGNATAANIIGLARRIQDGVHTVSNIVLQPEVRLIGFKRPPLG